MDNLKQEIKEKLDSLGQKKILLALTIFIYEKILDNKAIRLIEMITEEDLTTIKISNSVNFSFCLWNDTNRFTFFIEDREVMGNYLTNEKESLECVSFLKTVFGNPIEIEYHKKINKNKRYKVVYKYFVIDENEHVTLFSDEAIYSIKLPWEKIEKVSKQFPSLW